MTDTYYDFFQKALRYSHWYHETNGTYISHILQYNAKAAAGGILIFTVAPGALIVVADTFGATYSHVYPPRLPGMDGRAAFACFQPHEEDFELTICASGPPQGIISTVMGFELKSVQRLYDDLMRLINSAPGENAQFRTAVTSLAAPLITPIEPLKLVRKRAIRIGGK